MLPLLLTYVLHAGAWALLATCVGHWSRTPWSLRSACWRLALLAPLVTTAFTRVLPPTLQLFAAPTASSAVPAPAPPVSLAALVGVASLLGMLRWLGASWLLQLRVRRRWPLLDARWLRRAEHWRRRTQVRAVRLTCCDELTSPLVLGRAEICIPTALLAIEDDAMDALLAHELGHLERADGVWFPFVALIEAAVWWQPLNRWAAARFRASAELACDERAVELTQDATALARAIVRVATLGGAPRYSLVATMVGRESQLKERVRRLLAKRERSAHFRGSQLGVMALGCVLLSVNLGYAAPVLPEPLAAAPDGLRTAARLARLERQAAAVEARHGVLVATGNAASQQGLELEQELRHLRETQQWVEQTFLEGEVRWKQSQKRRSR